MRENGIIVKTVIGGWRRNPAEKPDYSTVRSV